MQRILNISLLSISISIFFVFNNFAQNSHINSRVQAIKNDNIVFYNIDGYRITNSSFAYPFTEKGLKKVYRKYGIKKKDTKIKEENLLINNYCVIESAKIIENLYQENSYYFIENEHKSITVIQFSAINKRDKDFEVTMINSIMQKSIPKENYASMIIDSINFAGRKIMLGNNCRWVDVNNVQCPYYGQMNWSIHKGFESAKTMLDEQYAITKSRKGSKLISEEIINVIFEGLETKVKRVVYKITGVNSLLSKALNASTSLTVYYMVGKAKGNYVSVVFSFWDDDVITEQGITPFLEKIIKLEK